MFKFKDETTLVHRLRRAHIQKEISVADVVVFMGYHAEGAIRG